ncbi:YlaH-like family protein [Paenibacillus koleovorans]|uniref:YlaH-like family protein n=1 Tax=Paenibacillus koleovorans TaxID=121608 RepID=UPI000FD9486D|nr:YlaH-like family protein [Paenibacillus koleovorans]
MQSWLAEHLWITYILIFVFLVYIYNKVFRTRRLPVLKAVLFYILMAVGAFILLLFQVDLELPIVLCLGVAVGLMLMLRIRYWVEERQKRQSDKPSN